METAFGFLLQMFADILNKINSIPFIFGYTLLQFMVSASLLVLIWQLIIWILGRSSEVVRIGIKRNYSEFRDGSNLAHRQRMLQRHLRNAPFLEKHKYIGGSRWK